MKTQPDPVYRAMVASGDDPDAPERIRVDHRGDRAVVTLDESDRLNVLSAPLGASTAADAAGPRR